MTERDRQNAANIVKLHAYIAKHPHKTQMEMAAGLHWSGTKFNNIFAKIKHEYGRVWMRIT
jgi:hypothetical protein